MSLRFAVGKKMGWVALAAAVSACACGKDASRASLPIRADGPRGAPSVEAAAATSAPPAEPKDPPALPEPPPPPRTSQEIGPFEIPFMEKRNVYYTLPVERQKPHRVIAMLHGVCNPPGYACWYWHDAASKRGVMVCPRGNAECGPGVSTWNESIDKIDGDLEKSIEAVDAKHPGEISREGSFLTGFSLGASVAPTIAKKHPGRWPYLILIEATVPLDAKSLRKAGVKGVAMLAGEIGENVYGQRAIAANLAKQNFPVKTYVMPKAGHWYSANIDQLMGDAMDWLLENGEK